MNRLLAKCFTHARAWVGAWALWITCIWMMTACSPLAAQTTDTAPSRPDTVAAELQSTIQDLQTQLKRLQSALERVALRQMRNTVERTTAPIPATPEGKALEVQTAFEEGAKAEEAGRYSAAVDRYSRAILVDASNDSAYLHRGACLIQLQEPLLAIDDLTESLRLQPNNAKAYQLRAAAFAAAEKYPEAIADLDEAVGRSPSEPGNYVQRARAYQKSGNFESALADLTTAVGMEKSGSVYIERAHLNLAMGRRDAALEDCTHALEADDKLEKGYLCRAMSLIALGRPQDAAGDLRDVLVLRPELPEAKTLLELSRIIPRAVAAAEGSAGVNDMRLGSRVATVASGPDQRTATTASATTSKDPASLNAKESLALTLRGRGLVQRGNFQQSIELFSKAIEMDPQSALAYNSRGYSYLRLRDYAHAIEDFQAALRINAEYANAKINLSVAMKLKGMVSSGSVAADAVSASDAAFDED